MLDDIRRDWVGPKPASRAAKKIGRPSPQCQTCSPDRDRLSIEQRDIGGLQIVAVGFFTREEELRYA
jgi:hypothetical protein